MVEIWLPVVGFEGIYEVSSLGAVRSLAREQRSYGSRIWLREGRTLSLVTIADKGYKIVSLSRDGKAKRPYVHDLVLTAHVSPRPSPKHHACHGREGPGVNTLANLRWDTARANVLDKLEHGTMPLGEAHWKNKYTERQISEAVRLMREGLTAQQASNATGVATTTIYAVRAGRQWKNAP